MGFPSGASGEKKKQNNPLQETRVQSLGKEDSLEEKMATHSSILAWKILWTEEPDVHGVAKSQTRLSTNALDF